MENPSESQPRTFTVSELNTEARQLLESGFGTVQLRGEISGVTFSQPGHCYFTLKDNKAEIRCVLFAFTIRTNRIRRESIEQGKEVTLAGKVTVYEARGSFQFRVESVQLEDEGALYRKFQQLKSELQKLGYFSDERKRPLPEFPKRVGIVTSPSGAAVHDIIRAFNRRNSQIRLLIYPSAVQGEFAPAEIAAAIALANSRNEVDVLLVSRGGGSLEDLAAFNDRAVADAILGSKIPVVTGIGHQTDVSIADWVADKPLATPTAAAEHISTPSKDEMLQTLSNLESDLQNSVTVTLNNLEQRIDLAERSLKHPKQRIEELNNRFRSQLERISLLAKSAIESRAGQVNVIQQQLLNQSPANSIRLHHQNIDTVADQLRQCATNYLDKVAARVETLATQLEAMNPNATLNRGYAIIRRKEDGNIVSDAKSVAPGDKLKAQLASGSLDLDVDAVNP